MSYSKFSRLISSNGPILVTGHTGFKGSWLTLLLDTLEIEWVGISLPPQQNSLYSLIKKHRKVKNREFFMDIRDYVKVTKVINKIKPKYAIHLAAQSLVLDSYDKPRETFEINVMGTVNILEALVNVKSLNKVIVATTDKVYKEKLLKKGFKESDSLGGKDPYSWSKIGSEAAVGAWQQISFNSEKPLITSVRSGNVIGGGDLSNNRLLPDLIKSFISNTNLEVRNPESTRPWQHVLDPLAGYLLSLQSNDHEKAFNFSPNSKSLNVKKVVEIANKAWGNKNEIHYHGDNSPLESKTLNLNSGKANKILGWQNVWTQEEAIVSTIDWWKLVTSKSLTANEACLQNIRELLNEI